MDFAFSEEQEEFRATLRRFLDERAPIREARRLMEGAESHDPGVWKRMAEELGLQGLRTAEAYGGQDFGFLELCIVLEEMGRVLFSGPFLSTVCLAAPAIQRIGSPADREALLPGIVRGETLASLALLEDGGDWARREVQLCARPGADGFRLSGSKSYVLDGEQADLILVVARLERTRGADGLTLLAVRADAEGLSSEPLETLDGTRRQARLAFDDVLARPIGTPGAAGLALDRVLDEAAVLLAAECVGGAESALQSAVGYAQSRLQFGRPIGSFQAIKHKCVEVLLEVESARAAVHWAGWVADQPDGDLAEAASVAKSLACDAYLRAAAENVHIHGGIGVTWEADPQLHLKRAKGSEALLGDPVFHRTRLARGMGV